MRHRVFTIVVLVLGSALALGAQATIERLTLDDGLDDLSRLTVPVIDGSGTAPLSVGAFTAAYDRKALFVRRGGGNLFTRGPEYKLDAAVDVTALVATAVATQAAAMGFRAGEGDAAWRLSGTVRDVYLESRQIPYGATLFYGYLDVELRLDPPTGSAASTAATVPMRLHVYHGSYNAGLGRRDEAQSAAAHLFVEGAQEMIARLNRAYFKAPPHASIAGRLSGLRPGTAHERQADVRAIGLSGLPEGTEHLLSLLAQEPSESGRSVIIDALGVLGSPASVTPLATRYAIEDEDCRWYTLKAMDYIGGDAAMTLVSASGLNDKDVGPKRLAQRISRAR